MQRILKDLVSRIVSFIPTTNLITFNSYPDYTDNAYAMLLYLSNKGYYNKYKFIWLVNEKQSVSEIQKKIDDEGFPCRAIYKKSFGGLWSFVRCRYCFYTHGILESLHMNQHNNKMVNMWHGMPIKNIGLTDNKGKGYMANLNVLLSSSAFFQDIMAACFGVNKNKVLPIGQPRCDMLTMPTDFFKQHGIRRSDYENVGIWLPTYRASTIGDIRTDGKYQPGCISFMNEDMLELLDAELQRLHQLLLIKLHPMDALQQYVFRKFRDIIIIKQNEFKSQLYPLLGSCDYLLTDFSSVSIDFDICKKPIGLIVDDLQAYKNSRGFVFDDVLSVLPGMVISNYSELVEFIKKPQYISSRYQLNDFRDGRASARLVASLGL